MSRSAFYDRRWRAARGAQTRGPNNRFAMTHAEIAKILGTSRQNIANIERKALKKLRKILET